MRVQSIGDYYTLRGAAEALGVSYWQVWRAVHHQQPPTLLLGQTLLVRLLDVQMALMQQHLLTFTNDPVTGEVRLVRGARKVDWAAFHQQEQQREQQQQQDGPRQGA